MRKVISFILVLVIVGETFIFALNTQAATQSSAVEFTSCTTGNIAGTYLASQIAGYVAKLKNNIINSLTTVPVSDSTVQGNTDTGNAQFITKAYITDVIARCAARTILSVMVGNVFSVMRTAGRDGGVDFIRNWSNFQTQAQYRGENIFRAELSTAKMCDYLADGVKKSFGVDPKKQTLLGNKQNTRTDSLQTFGLAITCTLPNGFTTQKYQQDFAGNGGWDAWSRILLPQNNPYGIALLSQDEISKQRALQQSADTNQAIAGSGYTGISGKDKAGSCAVKSPSGIECIVYNDIKTTGSYIAANLAAGINSELTWITSAQGLGSIIANLTEILLNRLLDEGSPDEGKPRVADETGGIELPAPLCPDGSTPIQTPTPICVSTAAIKTQLDAKITTATAAVIAAKSLTPSDFHYHNTFPIADNPFKINKIYSVERLSLSAESALYSFERTLNQTTDADLISRLQSLESAFANFVKVINPKDEDDGNPLDLRGPAGGQEDIDLQRQLDQFQNNANQLLDDLKAMPACSTGPAVPACPVAPPPAVCTQLGQSEQDFMLPLLNGGALPQDVVNQTNQYFGLTTGNQAVYYPANNVIGLPEFYLAGPTTGRPVSPSTGLPWDVTVRCGAPPGPTGGTCPNGLTTGTIDHGDVVASVIASLTAAGQQFITSCDQFEITKRVAWQLRGEGAGLQIKTSGNNCQGYSVDIIAYPNGDAYDVVTSNFGPSWSPTCLIDPTSQYAPAINPGGNPVPGNTSGTIRSDFATCTKGTFSGNPNCDVVLNYTTTGAVAAEIKKNGNPWKATGDIGTNYPAGTQFDANPAPGTYTYTIFGFKADGTESQLANVTVIIQ